MFKMIGMYSGNEIILVPKDVDKRLADIEQARIKQEKQNKKLGVLLATYYSEEAYLEMIKTFFKYYRDALSSVDLRVMFLQCIAANMEAALSVAEMVQKKHCKLDEFTYYVDEEIEEETVFWTDEEERRNQAKQNEKICVMLDTIYSEDKYLEMLENFFNYYRENLSSAELRTMFLQCVVADPAAILVVAEMVRMRQCNLAKSIDNEEEAMLHEIMKDNMVFLSDEDEEI